MEDGLISWFLQGPRGGDQTGKQGGRVLVCTLLYTYAIVCNSWFDFDFLLVFYTESWFRFSDWYYKYTKTTKIYLALPLVTECYFLRLKINHVLTTHACARTEFLNFGIDASTEVSSPLASAFTIP